VAALVAPLRPSHPLPPTSLQQTEDSFDRLQARSSTLDVHIGHLPTYTGVAEEEIVYASPEAQETDDWTPGV
jgi:hypothetical protein